MKKIGYYHVFPFQMVEKGSSIVIWGMGEIGQHYLKQIFQTGYCNVEFAVDRNWSACKNPLVKVMPISYVKQASNHTKVIIANGNSAVAGEIKKMMNAWGIQDDRILWCDIIIDESIVVDDNIISQGKAVKRIGYYHIFPFQHVEKGESIILWGMGEVGRNYAKQIQRSNFCRVEYAVDSNWHVVKDAPVSVRSPQCLAEVKEGRIVIANGSKSVAEDIRKKLVQMGIEEKRILWDDMIVQAELVVREAGQRQPAGMPYLYGSESGRISRANPVMQTTGLLINYDVISFTIFDVLVFRRIRDRKVFYRMVGERLGCNDFVAVRTGAEIQARKRLDENCKQDPTIEDIYQIVQERTGIDARKGYETEIEMELELSIPNPYCFVMYRRIMLHEDKKILLLEDTCLGRAHLHRILTHCGYEINPETIYSSCDCFVSKGDNGGLFQLIKNVFGNKNRYGHVTFSQKELVLARSRGFGGYLYVSAHDGNPYRATDMSNIIGENYKQFVNRHLYQDEQVFSIHYEYGFVYGGLMVLGFTNWLRCCMASQKIDKVLFLASDGKVLRDVYRLISPVVQDVYVYWSEMIGLRMMARKERHCLLDKVLYNVNWDVKAPSVQEYLEKLHLGDILHDARHILFHRQQEMNTRVAKSIGNFLNKHWDEVIACFEREKADVKEYLQGIVGEARRIAVVDVSGYGDNGVLLAKVLKNEFGFDCHVNVYTVGSRKSFYRFENSLNGMDRVYPYCFSESFQKNLYNFHFSQKLDVQKFFSLLWSHPEPNVAGFAKNNGKLEFIFDTPMVEKYEMAREIQKGIIDYCTRYISHFSINDVFMDISGWDAYMPFRLIASQPDCLKMLLHANS